MKFKNNFCLRVFSILLAALITLTSVDVSAFSAPNNTGSNERISLNLSEELENQVQEAYKDLMKAYKSGKRSDFIAACKLIAKLSPTQCVRLYVLKYRDYYKQNYLKDNFAYFDVDKYLIAHPELINPQHSVSYNKEKALEYYLDYGIYKGDSACTEFDPIIAIVVQPSECVKAIVNDNNIPSLGLSGLKEAYTTAEGTDNTLVYDLESSFDEAVNGKFKADDGILYIGKKNTNPVSKDIENAVVEKVAALETATENEPKAEESADAPQIHDSANNAPAVSGDEERDPILDGGYGGPNNHELLINNKARKNIEGFKLHINPREIILSDDFTNLLEDNQRDLIDMDLDYTKEIDEDTSYEYDISYIANNYLNIANKNSEDVDYSKVKDTAKCTVMIYLCGTDLESGSGEEASQLVAAILKSKYDTSKVNVLICAGGTKTWKAGTLKENDGVKSSIYYLNPDAVSDSATGPDAKANDVINDNSLIKLTQIDTPIEMGQSEFLLGFMDMAYELFPAENFWLSLWNHGGGAKGGICFSEGLEGSTEITSAGLSLARMEEALASSKLYAADRKLGVMSFDACMMAGVEEAYNFSRYADYMVGSAELSSGDLGYVEAIKYIEGLSDNEVVDNKEVAKEAAVGSMSDKADYLQIAPATESAFDLSKMDEINKSNEELALCLDALIKDDSNAYREIRKATVRAKSYGANDKTPTWGYIDYYDFLTKLEVYLKELGNTSSVKFTKSRCDQAIEDIEKIINVKFILDSNISYGQQNDINKVETGKEAMSLKDVATGRDIKADLIYNKVFNNYLSAMSIYYPINDNGYQSLSRDDEEAMNNYLDEAVLHHYSYMLKSASNIANSKGEIERYKKIATALVNSNPKDNGMMNGITTSTYKRANADENFAIENVITVDFKKNYDQSYANDGVHIDPFTDFVDVVKDVTLLGLKNTKTYSIVDGKSEDTDDNYDIIIGSKNVQTAIGVSSEVKYKETGIIDNTQLRFDLSTNVIIGYLVEGFTAIFDLDSKEYKKKPDDDYYYQDWGHLLVDKDKYTIDYDTLGDGYNENNVYIFDGKYYFVNEGQQDSKNALLAFKKSDNGKYYSYLGVLSENGVTYKKTAEVDEQVKGVSFNHYTVDSDGKITRFEDLIDKKNENAEADEIQYIKNSIYIIDGTNSPIISEQAVAGMGYAENNTKIELEVNVYVPVATDSGEKYEEQSIVYIGDNELYLNTTGDESLTPEGKYKADEVFGTPTENLSVNVENSGDSADDRSPRCPEPEIIEDSDPISGSQVGTPLSEIEEHVDVVLKDDDVFFEEEATTENDEEDSDSEDSVEDNTDGSEEITPCIP